MSATVLEMSRDKKEDKTEPIRLAGSLVHKARMVAAHRKQSIADYLAEHLEGPVGEDYDAMIADLAEEKKKRQSRA